MNIEKYISFKDKTSKIEQAFNEMNEQQKLQVETFIKECEQNGKTFTITELFINDKNQLHISVSTSATFAN